jgi:hypothetical protein
MVSKNSEQYRINRKIPFERKFSYSSFMFYRFKWIELVYTFCGHIVVVTWLAILCLHLCDAKGQAWLATAINQDPFLCLLIGVSVIACSIIFAYAVLCSTAVLMQFLQQYQLAQQLYRFTLKIRQMIPLAGNTARIDVWNISLANCYRARGMYADAEQLYKVVLQSNRRANALDELTNYGLRDVTRENFVVLLEETERHAEADQMRKEIGKSATLIRLKYLAVSAAVLAIGAAFALFENAMLTELIN